MLRANKTPKAMTAAWLEVELWGLVSTSKWNPSPNTRANSAFTAADWLCSFLVDQTEESKLWPVRPQQHHRFNKLAYFVTSSEETTSSPSTATKLTKVLTDSLNPREWVLPSLELDTWRTFTVQSRTLLKDLGENNCMFISIQFSFMYTAPNHSKCHLKAFSRHSSSQFTIQLILIQSNWYNPVKSISLFQISQIHKKPIKFFLKNAMTMHMATVERKNSLLTGKNLWQNPTQEGQPSALNGWGLRGQERGDNRHHNTRLGCNRNGSNTSENNLHSWLNLLLQLWNFLFHIVSRLI